PNAGVVQRRRHRAHGDHRENPPCNPSSAVSHVSDHSLCLFLSNDPCFIRVNPWLIFLCGIRSLRCLLLMPFRVLRSPFVTPKKDHLCVSSLCSLCFLLLLFFTPPVKFRSCCLDPCFIRVHPWL